MNVPHLTHAMFELPVQTHKDHISALVMMVSPGMENFSVTVNYH
jgi:hypothetical protein